MAWDARQDSGACVGDSGLVGGLVRGLAYGLVRGLAYGLVRGLAYGLVRGLAYGLVRGGQPVHRARVPCPQGGEARTSAAARTVTAIQKDGMAPVRTRTAARGELQPVASVAAARGPHLEHPPHLKPALLRSLAAQASLRAYSRPSLSRQGEVRGARSGEVAGHGRRSGRRRSCRRCCRGCSSWRSATPAMRPTPQTTACPAATLPHQPTPPHRRIPPKTPASAHGLVDASRRQRTGAGAPAGGSGGSRARDAQVSGVEHGENEGHEGTCADERKRKGVTRRCGLAPGRGGRRWGWVLVSSRLLAARGAVKGGRQASRLG